MAKVSLICGNAADHPLSSQLIMTDPPFDMPGDQLASIIDRSSAQHLVLITTMRQLLWFMQRSDWELSFDFVLDAVAPKKSRSIRQPNYTHHTGVYLHRPGVESVFDRKARQRSDVFEANGYWPTIFHAPRERAQEHGMAKSITALTDLLGSFRVDSVGDPFAGSGTVAMAAFELGLDCELVELERSNCDRIAETFKFFGLSI